MVLVLVAGLSAAAVVIYIYRTHVFSPQRMSRLTVWLRDPSAQADWSIKAGTYCQGAPFAMPTDGYIGFLWGDSFRLGHHHEGIDIFGGGDVGQTLVYAAFPGYLTRLPDWKSTVIVRIPDDPLQPGRQIWAYYTHMADEQGASFISADFPPGTREKYIEAGTRLGYQGDFSGTPGNPTGVHLHFSIVLSDDQGSFRNELLIANTLDPSPYLGLPLNAWKNQGVIPVCNGD